MLPDFSKLIPKFENGMAELKNCLAHIFNETQASRLAGQATARALQFEFGVVDDDPTGHLSPRRRSQLPVVLEQRVTARTELDLLTLNQGRPVSRGFYANLGDNPFQVILQGLNGTVTNAHTLPPPPRSRITDCP